MAVKQVGNLPGESATDLDRALREARSAAGLHHPHVVAVFDAVEEDGRTWLVMEYVPSRTLAEILAAEGPLEPRRVAHLGSQAAEGLAAAHAGGVVHRDVKPGNLLVTEDDRVKITDFGIALITGDPRLTQSGLVVGTPSYFSPEAARGGEPDPSGDVWSLGASLYEAVEGHAPYAGRGGGNPLALLVAIAGEEAPPPERAGPLAGAIAAMMARDPAERWTMPEVAGGPPRHRGGRRRPGSNGGPRRPAGRGRYAARADAGTRAGTRAGARAGAGAGAGARAGRVARARRPVRRRATSPPRGRCRWWWRWCCSWRSLQPASPSPRVVTTHPRPTRRRRAATTAASARSRPTSPTSEPTTETSEPDGPESLAPPGRRPSPPPRSRTAADRRAIPPAFAETYYGYLPDDTGSAYQLLSRDYQAQTSQEDYEAFWNTIESVRVSGVEAVDDTTVDVSLTYVTADGSEPETRRLYLAESGDGWVIVNDEAV